MRGHTKDDLHDWVVPHCWSTNELSIHLIGYRVNYTKANTISLGFFEACYFNSLKWKRWLKLKGNKFELYLLKQTQIGTRQEYSTKPVLVFQRL